MNKLKKIFLSLSRGEKIVFAAALFMLAASAATLAVLYFRSVTQVVPAAGGEFTEGMVGQPTNVNPVLAQSEADKSLVRLLFANVAQLADQIEPGPNGRTWNVRLREGLRWSDGEKLTSDDVIFTIQKIQDPSAASPHASSWQGVTPGRVSELEIEFTLASPYPFFAENLRALYPIPQHLFAETPPANWKLSEYNLKPVSNGPYRFVSYEKQPNGFITLYRTAANPQFAGGAPLIEHFEFRYFTKNEDLLRAFNTGIVDAFGALDPKLFEEVQRPYALHEFRLPSYYGIFFNQGQNAALRDAAVRKAFSESVDREDIVRSIFDRRATPLANPLAVALGGDAPDAERKDRPAIEADLDAAGWVRGEDGIRAKTEGRVTTKLEIVLTVPRLPFLTETAAEIRSAWEAIGAKVDLKEVAPEEIMSESIRNRDYQAILFGNILNPAEDLYAFWHTNERFHPGLNLAIYSSREADQLIESIRRELDPVKRRTNLGDLASTLAEDNPAILLYSPHFGYAASKSLRGVEPQLLTEAADRFLGIEAWHLKTARILK